jgi:hypothetical protein
MKEMGMSDYEAPSITELGTVAEFTRADQFAIDFDGAFFRGDKGGGGS